MNHTLGHMKIFHCFFGFRMGGSETLVVDLANEQARRGHDVTLLAVNSDVDPALLATLLPAVHRILIGRRPGSRNPLPVMRLNAILARRRPDAVHLHNIGIAGMILPPLRRRLICTLHTTGIDLRLGRGAVRLAAISPTVREEALARHPGADIEVIHNSIDFEAVSRRPDTPAFGDTLRIVQLGRLFPEIKGQDLLIRALGILAREGISNISAEFIGDGSGRQQLEELARNEGVLPQVSFAGSLSRRDTYRCLATYDLMIHPSRIEGFGLAVIEGMAAGLPVVVPDRGAPFEITRHGQLARTFAYGDARSLAGTLRQIHAGYAAAHSLAAPARQYAMSLYSLPAMADAYQRAYSGL